MGIFKKIGKGLKKAFKKIGKGVKSAFKKFGKFMGKIGIVGQLALSFVLPGVGAMFAKGFNATIGAGFGKLTGALAKGGKFMKAAGKILESGAKFAKAGTSAFKTVTDGVSNFFSEFSKTALKKIPGMQEMMPEFLGKDVSDTFFADSATGKSAWSTVQSGIDKNITAITESFNEGVEKFGGAKKILTAEQQNIVKKAGDITGKGTIPGGTARAPTDMGGASQAGANAGFEIKYKPTDSLLSTSDFDLKAAGLDTVNVATDTTGFSFGEKAKGFVTGLPGEIKEGITEKYTKFLDGRSLPKALAQEGVQTVFESATSGFESGIEQRAFDLVQEEPPEQFGPSSTAAYQSVGISDYASPQVNDRAMQMSINPQAFYQANPIGAGAYQYYEEMKLRQGGSTAYG